uniref:UBA domain-containing protein n=1 Tax=Anolis carolinensis TaxID=28377 RepID=A0A803U021_ANOCA
MFVLCFGTAADPAVPVFEMLYETNPVRSRFERRLEVSTQPLNIIYNPQAIRKVADFFYKGRVHTSGFGCQSELELRVAEAARRQYNKLKMQTKAEIRQTIDRLLVGDFIEDSKRWTVCLDISAPQVIFPDDFKFPDPVLVVIDLGRMLLTNSQEEHKKKSPGGPSSELSDLSDDEYKTPLATPPSSPPPEAEAENKEFEFSGVEISEEQLQAHLMSKKMYDTYNLSFMDLQIMVGRVRDNWKYAQDIAVGPTHVVEKFNVHLQLERRLIYTSDPKYPGAVLSGHLPDLKIHINEDKIMALSNCFGRLTASESATASPSQSRKEAGSADLDQRGSLHSSVMNLTQSVMVVEQHTKEVLVESQLLLAEFQVNCMQLGVESNGRYISVLKVFGTNAHFIKRPYDAEVSLTVHGLLLVDTMQTYGSDFDLLVASHKNLSLDVPTGSLRDRRMHSPVGAPGEDGKFPGPASRVAPHDESLIKLEYQFVSTECPSMNLDSTLQVISVQMNNLDIILNPETIVELIGFLQKSFPKEKDHSSPQPLMTEAERHLSEHETFQFTHSQNTEVTVDIHWLNVLLLRTVTVMNGEKLGRKIATASVGGTKVNVSMGTKLDVNGSLGCLHLMDLTQDVKNQYVVSIGNTVRYENLIRDASCSRPAFLPFDDAGNLPDALSFTFTEQSKEECSLHLKMASLHYNHSAKFLKELSLSMDELEDNFRGMLKHAATRVTTVLATKTAEYSEMVSLFDTAPRSRDPFNLESGEGEESVPARSKTEPIKLILDVNIESPVVSIPRRPGSSELLVGHLGQISIRNFVAGEDNLRNDRLQVEIRDIRLYSLNSSHVTGKKESVSEVPHGSSVAGSSQEDPQFTRHDFFESLHKGHAFHILNNATIQFELEKIPVERDAELAFSADEDIEISSLMRIEGKFVNPLQVVLAKHVYEQVLQTLDNLVCNEDLTHPPSGFPSSKCPSSDSPSALIGSTSSDFSLERKENGLFSHSGFGTPTGKFAPSKETTPSFTQIQATFHLSELQVQLSGDLTLGAQGLVSLKFQDFDIEFAKDHPQTLSIQIALRSLLMEDLLEKNPDSQYKNLMVSRGAPKPSGLAHKEYLSQSCPSVSNAEYPDMPRSLPSHMEEAPNVFQFYQRPTWAPHKKLKEDEGLGCPLTPPPSPTANESHPPSGKSDFDDSLVHINVLLVDKKHPAFATSYGKISRSVDVDFNCLDVLITLQTWVVILDFFGIGSTAENHSMKSQPGDVQLTVKSEASASPALEAQDAVNTKVDLKVHSLSLVLNKATNELAKANVSKLITHVDMIEGDLSLHGSIGSLSLSDLTSHGELYRERFTTSGEEAFIFQVYKYGRPDPLLQRDCDVRISLRMASVRYVHTQRFQAEVVSFIQHFTQLQDVLGRQRAAIEGQMVRDQAQRSARVLLDIEAGAPVLLIPESSLSNHLIVANLGKLKVKNRFLFAGTAGTFSLKDKDSVQLSSPLGTPKHSMKKTPSADESKAASGTPEGLFMKSSSSGPNLNRLKSESVVGGATKPPKSPESPEEHVCLLDCIVVDLQDMDIFAAERFSREYSEATEEAQADLTFPSFVIRQAGGSLLTEPFRLKLQVERNLDKEISHVVPDISVHGILSSILCALDLDKYKLIRGLLENNLGEPIEEFMRPYDLQDPRIHTVLSGEVYTCMSFLIDMVNVSLELTNPQGKRGSLARFDFKKSKLLFESFSNQTKSINLVSHSMMAFDTRYAGQRATSGMPNVFHCIFQSSKNSTSQGAIQIELHYRSTKDSSFFTVVLNNLRVFLIFDWLVLVHDFLRTASEARKQPGPLRQRHSSSEAAVAVVPKAVKSGIVTKRSSLQLSAEKQLEVKINVTDTEFVVVEDMSCADTNAIILKGTTVLTYKPKLVDHPFSGSLSGIEVFSCRLGNEQETALSIIDPALIQVELVGSSSYPSGSGLLDAFNSEDFPPILEIQLQALDIRLSYNDVQLFLAIAKSIPGQTGSSSTVGGPCSSSTGTSVSTSPSGSTQAKEVSGLALDVTETSRHTLDPVLEVQLARLQELGFSLDDCRKALLDCQGQLKKAASWLFKNAEPLKCLPPDPNSRDSHGPSSALRWVSGLDVKAESICICFIDDCMDCDVPLAELTFSRLNFLQHLRTSPEGYAHFTLSGDYYNRELSGWEPFIEPWPCSVSWLQQSASRLHPPRLKLEVKAKHRLDINVTSVLLEQYTSTKQSWMEDYCKHENAAEETESEEWMGSSVDPPSFGQSRSLPLVYLRTRSTASLTNLEHQMYARAEMKTPKRRQPFVPFALRNHTGCTLWFFEIFPSRHPFCGPLMLSGRHGEGLHQVSSGGSLEHAAPHSGGHSARSLISPFLVVRHILLLFLDPPLLSAFVCKSTGPDSWPQWPFHPDAHSGGWELCWRWQPQSSQSSLALHFARHSVSELQSPTGFCRRRTASSPSGNPLSHAVRLGVPRRGSYGLQCLFRQRPSSQRRPLSLNSGNSSGIKLHSFYSKDIKLPFMEGHIIFMTCALLFSPNVDPQMLLNSKSHKFLSTNRALPRGQGTTNPEGYISTLPGSSVVFHWPRNDYDQLLCVRLMDVPNCIWSGGFEVNKNNSFHINMRDTLGRCYFLRVEITLKGATFRVSFSDTDQLPPPFRIDNFSKVPVVFSQHGVAEPRLSTEVKPGSSLDYAWDEPTLLPYVTLTVKGAGSSEVTCCMDNFQDSKQLYYENFIYIAATYTFSGLQEESGRPVASNKEVERAELVLDVSLKTQRVILKKKEPGKRSQLWRMTGAGMLCHEGSAVPHPPNKPSPPRSAESSMILDIAGLAAVTDNRYEPLMLRKPDRRRSTTQTWSFRDGKLVCGMHGLVVQVKGGLSGLRDGAEVVLGPDTAMEMLGPVPPEQQFVNQKMRPGSGVLVVRVIPDGPTRVLQITDFNQRRNDRFSYEGEELEQDLQRLKNPDTEQELEVQLKLEGGVGLSLVNKVPEELIFASFTGINVHFMQLSTSQVLELSIQDVQVDNQLLRTTQPFMLFLTPKSGESEAAETGPAVQLNAMKFPSKRPLTDIYKHLMITASKFTVQIEEKLFLKLLSFFGYDQTESEVESYDENVHERPADQGGAQKRYYFENLKISMPQIKLSVFTSSKLPLDLKALKSTLGFPLVRFEDAVINLDPFTRVHPYETKDFIINDILKHFQEELLSQAARILSSVDFLGNPMGLLNDVSEGVTGLIKYGNVGGLFRNVAHGVSNSAAKFTGTLSDGLGKTMDNRHQTEREYIRYHAATSGEHLVAGIQGLAHGILGGLTSVITSTVEGVKTEGGVSGFISGLGKGLVGTVTKPVAGALDFASETAQAVRETATLTGPRYCKSHRPWFILPLTSPGRIGVHSGSVSKVSSLSMAVGTISSLWKWAKVLQIPSSVSHPSPNLTRM